MIKEDIILQQQTNDFDSTLEGVNNKLLQVIQLLDMMVKK